jgi:hypothetical protein
LDGFDIGVFDCCGIVDFVHTAATAAAAAAAATKAAAAATNAAAAAVAIRYRRVRFRVSFVFCNAVWSVQLSIAAKHVTNSQRMHTCGMARAW